MPASASATAGAALTRETDTLFTYSLGVQEGFVSQTFTRKQLQSRWAAFTWHTKLCFARPPALLAALLMFLWHRNCCSAEMSFPHCLCMLRTLPEGFISCGSLTAIITYTLHRRWPFLKGWDQWLWMYFLLPERLFMDALLNKSNNVEVCSSTATLDTAELL